MTDSVFRLEADPDGPHVQRPDTSEVTQPALDPLFFQPLALIDAGALDDSLAGHDVLCLGFSTGAVDEYFVIEKGDDGLWTLVDVDGGAPEDPSRPSSYAEGFEDGEAAFQDLKSVPNAKLTAVEDSERNAMKDYGVLLRCGEPAWEQSPDAPQGDQWRFIARLNSYYMHGSVYVFYDPTTRRAHHLKQYT